MTLVKLLGGAVFTGMLGGAVHLQLADLHLPNHVLESKAGDYNNLGMIIQN